MGFFDFLGPGAAQRRLGYTAAQGALRSDVAHAQDDASRRVLGDVRTAAGTSGNPMLAGRLAARSAGDVRQRLGAQGMQQMTDLRAQQAQQETLARERDSHAADQLLGGLLGAGGQALGFAIPAFGALGGPQMAQGALGAMGLPTGQPQAPSATAPTPQQQQTMAQGMWPGDLDPFGRPMSRPQPQAAPAPTGAVIGSAGGPTGFTSPTGAPETAEERWRRLQLGGGFLPRMGG